MAFLKSVLWRLFTTVVSTVVSFFLVLVLIGVLIGSLSQKEMLPEKAVLEIDLSSQLTDAPRSGSLEGIVREMADSSGNGRHHLREMVENIRRAGQDSRVVGIVLKGSSQPIGYASGFPALQEMRDALLEFRQSGKPVIAYTDGPNLRDLFLHSVASDALINQAGTVILPGLYSEPMFFANAMDTWGIGVQTVRVGDFKSAVEPFTRTNLSKEAREASESLLQQIWMGVLAEIATARGMDVQELHTRLSKEPILEAKTAVEWGLYNRTTTLGALKKQLAELGAPDNDNGGYVSIAFPDYVQDGLHPVGAKIKGADKPAVAVVYAEGPIVDGWGDADQVGSDRIADFLRKAGDDEKVKAIVLRINSPGGSASASEIIQDELLRVKSMGKPLVVSMGSYAASGGYLIAQSADRIYVNPHTVTGSIGIFGLFFNIGEGASKLGITFDEIKTMPHSDLQGIAKPKSDAQIALVQGFISDFYDRWISTIGQYRSIDEERIREIARGRVWSGRDAVELKLADEVGDLYDAIRHAAGAANLSGEYDILDYPAMKTQEEIVAEALGLPVAAVSILDGIDFPVLQPKRVSAVEAKIREASSMLQSLNDPLSSYALCPLVYE